MITVEYFVLIISFSFQEDSADQVQTPVFLASDADLAAHSASIQQALGIGMSTPPRRTVSVIQRTPPCNGQQNLLQSPSSPAFASG